VREVVGLFHTAFPDLVVAGEDTITEQDQVAIRFTIRGTQTGPFAGLPATGRSVVITGIAISRIATAGSPSSGIKPTCLGSSSSSAHCLILASPSSESSHCCAQPRISERHGL
jgi:SnoaL-like polyketide cyclase